MAQLHFSQINRMTPSTQILENHLTTNSQVSLRDRTKVCPICIPALHGSSHCFHNTGTASCCKRQNSWIIQTFYKHPPLHILVSIYGSTNQTDFVMLTACGFNGCCSSRARWTQVPNLGHTKKRESQCNGCSGLKGQDSFKQAKPVSKICVWKRRQEATSCRERQREGAQTKGLDRNLCLFAF